MRLSRPLSRPLSRCLSRPLSRRQLLQTTVAVGASLTLGGCATTASTRKAMPANHPIRLAVIGINGRGNQLLKSFRALAGVQIVALCDVDPSVLALRMGEATKLGEKPVGLSDPRQVFDRSDVDAVVIATPNHTHSVLGSWAMQAGKDVYLEKPVSHDIDEGLRLIAAQKRTGRIIAAGTQNRSDVGLRAAFADLHAGKFGAIEGVHGFCFRDRATIGKAPEPIKPPAGLHYDLWLGPAADEPIRRPKFHYDWHWVWNTGNGDLGNQGPHELDMACWALGDLGYPEEAMGIGGRFAWNDAGETANLMTAWYRFKNGIPLVFEVRNLPPMDKTKGAWNGLDKPAIAVMCAQGTLQAWRGGAVLKDAAGKTLQEWKGDGGETHQANFIDAVRSGRAQDLHAPLEKSVVSAGLAHVGNTSLRLGARGDAAAATTAAKGRLLLDEHVDRMANVLRNYQIDLAQTPFSIGPALRINGATGLVIGDHAVKANALSLIHI